MDNALLPILKEFEQEGVIVPTAQTEEVLEFADSRLPLAWPKMARWVDEEREYLQWVAGIEYRVAGWTKVGRPNSRLLSASERSDSRMDDFQACG